MGSGSTLMDEIIVGLSDHGVPEGLRAVVYSVLIPAMRSRDWGTGYDCCGQDPVYDWTLEFLDEASPEKSISYKSEVGYVAAEDVRKAIEPVASWYDVGVEDAEPVSVLEVVVDVARTLLDECEEVMRLGRGGNGGEWRRATENDVGRFARFQSLICEGNQWQYGVLTKVTSEFSDDGSVGYQRDGGDLYHRCHVQV
jgi:hypothetical protein